MKKQNKKYSRPRKPFDKARITEEDLLREEYGLKNKREIWKAEAAIRRIRNLAKQLITRPEEEKTAFTKKLQKKGFNVTNISEALALKKEDWLKRRLQTIVFSRKLTNTPKQARQLVAHKHVSIGDQVINIPSYQVSLEEEPLVRLNIVLKTLKPKSKIEKIKDKMKEDKKSQNIQKDIEEEIEEEEEKIIEEIKKIEETGVIE
ncbi:MAG: 30S ribosomal protein S4 [archaeon]|jgi:small subunit ribosomal protein S4